jgi:hypothetical protein
LKRQRAEHRYRRAITDDEWELVKRELGIERGWEAAYQLVSGFDLPSMQPSADVTPEGASTLFLVLRACQGDADALGATHAEGVRLFPRNAGSVVGVGS